MPFDPPRRYTTRRSAGIALDHQRIDGFSVNVGPQNHGDISRFFVIHPHPRMWMVVDRTTGSLDAVAWGSIRDVLNYIFQ